MMDLEKMKLLIEQVLFPQVMYNFLLWAFPRRLYVCLSVEETDSFGHGLFAFNRATVVSF